MDSLLIHQQANDLVQNFGTRNIKKIALNVGMEISETDCFHELLGLFAFQWHNHMVFINQRIDKYTKQMVCGYAVGHYLEHPNLNSVKKFIAIKDKHIILHPLDFHNEPQSNLFSTMVPEHKYILLFP